MKFPAPKFAWARPTPPVAQGNGASADGSAPEPTPITLSLNNGSKVVVPATDVQAAVDALVKENEELIATVGKMKKEAELLTYAPSLLKKQHYVSSHEHYETRMRLEKALKIVYDILALVYMSHGPAALMDSKNVVNEAHAWMDATHDFLWPQPDAPMKPPKTDKIVQWTTALPKFNKSFMAFLKTVASSAGADDCSGPSSGPADGGQLPEKADG